MQCTLAGLAAERGDDRAALAGYQEALQCWAGIGERWTIAAAFSGLAALAAGHGQPEQAATLIGVIDTRLEESGAGPWLSDRPRYDWATATAAAALGAARFAVLREAGRALPFAAAVAAGMAVTVPDSRSDPSTVGTSIGVHWRLDSILCGCRAIPSANLRRLPGLIVVPEYPGPVEGPADKHAPHRAAGMNQIAQDMTRPEPQMLATAEAMAKCQ